MNEAGVLSGQRAWRTGLGSLSLDRPRVMGILNVTPDSFWAGSRSTDPSEALARADAMLEEGADLLDVGGESTRPGARAVSADLEVSRVVPVVRALARRYPQVPVSVDTVKSDVARAALAEGAAIVNDVSGLRLDPALGPLVAEHGAGLVLMHSRGTVERMASYDEADYDADAVGLVVRELSVALQRAAEAGVDEASIVVDPGLGFAKRTDHSVDVLAGLPRIAALGRPILVGPSRKRFIGELAGGAPPEDRLPGTIAACVAALDRGASIFRVHDVGPVRQALTVAHAIRAER
ncbi:MAG: dihydropteroate synthase [Gemmatimonadota bacterium]|jgi:dihydropteroate synthase